MMIMRYPNGQPFTSSKEHPTKKNKSRHSKVDFSNRGMRFEDAINESNLYYLNHNLAVIHKKPTPIQIVKVDYPHRSAATIKEAYFKQASTTDYNGVYRGFYLDFEAKETQNKTSFPLKNFHEHQIQHMKQCLEHGGICFVLLWFSQLKRCFYLSAEELIIAWENQTIGGKKSLPLSLIEDVAIEIKTKIAPRIPYLQAVDLYISEYKELTT